MARIVLNLCAALWLLAACASTQKTVTPQPAPAPLPKAKEKDQIPRRIADRDLADYLKDFHLEIVPENKGECPGPDGKNMIYLGRHAEFYLVLRFARPLPEDIDPARFIARFADLEFPFYRESAEDYFTQRIELSSLEPGSDIEPRGISIYYKDHHGEVFLGKQQLLAIDTTPPPRPENLRVKECGPKHFTLTWDSGKRDIKEYLLQKWESGRWRTLRSGFSTPPLRVDCEPKGRVRVVAVDCALNRDSSREIDLEENCLVDVRVEFRAFRYDAAAKVLVSLREGDVLRDGDRMKLELIPNRECYLYVINIDSEERSFVLFPHSLISVKNPVPASQGTLLPGRKRSFRVDSTKGAEFIYVFVSLDRDEELELLMNKMMKEMNRERSQKTTQNFREFLGHRGLTTIEADSSFTSHGDYRDVLEKKVNELQAAKKYMFPHL